MKTKEIQIPTHLENKLGQIQNAVDEGKRNLSQEKNIKDETAKEFGCDGNLNKQINVNRLDGEIILIERGMKVPKDRFITLAFAKDSFFIRNIQIIINILDALKTIDTKNLNGISEDLKEIKKLL